MIISLTILSNGQEFAIDTNAFALTTYTKLAALAAEYPYEQCLLVSYSVNNSGTLEISHYPITWAAQPKAVDLFKAMQDVRKLLG